MDTSENIRLRFININQYYGESHILRNVSLAVPAMACTTILGRNGVGKTTLLDVLMGLNPARSGDIEFDGTSLQSYPPEQRAKIGLGYVPQGRQIFPLLTVEENLRIGLSARADKSTIVPQFIYDLFPVLFDMRGRRGGDLSGGQQQQLAIGRALASAPEVLILDEPTEGIQPNIVQEICDVIRRLISDYSMTVLLVEQKLPIVRQVSDYFQIMVRGQIVKSGVIAELDEQLIKTHLQV